MCSVVAYLVSEQKHYGHIGTSHWATAFAWKYPFPELADGKSTAPRYHGRGHGVVVKFSLDFSLGSTTGLQIPASGMLYKKLVEINYLEYHILPLFVREAPHPCVFPFDWWQNLIFMDSPPSANLPTIWDWILDYASRELHATPAFELKYTSIVIRAERPPWGCFDS